MSKQILSEEFRRMQKLAGLINEGEMWDKDSSHRDTYGDYDDERNYEEEQEYGNAEIVRKRVSPDFPEYTALIDDRGDEYTSFKIFNTKSELEKEMEDETYGEKAGYYELPDGKVAVAFPYRGSKGEDFGGM
jgi:hypothetical protein